MLTQRPRETLERGLTGRYVQPSHTLFNPQNCPTIGVHLKHDAESRDVFK